MTPLNRSADDLSLPRPPPATPERRARLASPVKNRRLCPPGFDYSLPSLPMSTEDLTLTTLSVTSLSPEQLRTLLASPVSKRLHVSNASNPIPIPFTLRLPPKLSPKNQKVPVKAASTNSSPLRKKQTRLVYTGLRYEKLDNLSDEDEPLPSRKSRPVPPMPKPAKLMFQTRSADELSIIEEVSSGSSRASSVRSTNLNKALPQTPKRSLSRKPPPTDEAPPVARTIPHPTLAPQTTLSPAVHVMPSPTQTTTQTTIKVMPGPGRTMDRVNPTSPGARSMVASESRFTLAGAQTSGNILRIEKRSFSDESHVSSVSSFSSVGDIMNFPSMRSRRLPLVFAGLPLNSVAETPVDDIVNTTVTPVDTPRAIAPPPPTVTRNASDSSAHSSASSATQSSWNSLQKSIDISIENSKDADSVSTVSEKSKDLPPIPQDLVSDASDIQPLRISRNPTVSPEKVEPPRRDVSMEKSDSENEGAGQRFSFPNTEENVTNNDELRQAVRSSGLGRSRFSYVTNSSGQIEIPDLLNKSVAESFSTKMSTLSYNGTTFDDVPSAATSETSASVAHHSKEKLEPIGIPTRASQLLLREQLKLLHDDDDSDTDLLFNMYKEPVFRQNVTVANVHVKPSPLHHTYTAPQQPQKRAVSPARHRRNRSMFSIDVNSLEVSPTRKHSRSKSIDPKLAAATEMNIVVAEAPKPIDYAVDFKESSAKDNFPRNPSHAPTVHEIYSAKAQKSQNKVNLVRDMRQLSLNNSDAKLSRKTSRNDSPSKKHSPPSRNDSKSSRTSHASNASAKLQGSVVIDLTEDNYDVCTIQRQDSVTSYRSVTEKTKDGKEVEVVLVDEDTRDRDDLSSIYSKYHAGWLNRSGSVTSTGSESSTASFDSGVGSEAQLRVKPSTRVRPATVEIYNQMALLRGQPGSLLSAGSAYRSKRIQPPKRVAPEINPSASTQLAGSQSQPNLTLQNRESEYFDYTTNYDFNTFMKQRAVSRPA